MSKYKILAIFANHTSSIIKYNLSLTNFLMIKKNVDNIVIIDTNNEEYSKKLHNDLIQDNKIINYLFVENDQYLDFGKWVYALQNIDSTNYDYILFINDSIILTDTIDNFFIYLHNHEKSINLYAYNDSSQIKYHYQSYLFFISTRIIKNFINFFESKKPLIHDYTTLTHNVELNMCKIDESHDCFIKIANEWNSTKNIFWENEILYQYLLTKNIFHIIKLKKISDIQKEYKISIYGKTINNFNFDFYRNHYSDLITYSNDELLNHFVENGQYEGRKFDINFNSLFPEYYKDHLNKIGLLQFFDIPSDFDVYYYRKLNSDIADLSNIELVYHYINYGIYESRPYTKFYLNNKLKENTFKHGDIIDKNIEVNLFYIDIINKLFNKDYSINSIPTDFCISTYQYLNNISEFGNLLAIKHYIENGSKKNLFYKKETITDFDYIMYKKIYKDLSKLKKHELKEHYMMYGKNEGRIYKIPDDFDILTYKKIYNDMYNLSDVEIKKHYLFHGHHEKRIYKLPDDFDSIVYKKIYSDLEELNNDDLKMHYLKIGHAEKRLYKIPSDFDYITYKKIYIELKDLTNDELRNHYLFYGYREKKIYKIPDDFDYVSYKKIYTELNELDNNRLEDHYLSIGIKENRIYKIPSDFDKNTYKKIYQDLALVSDDKLAEHYLLYGYKENRRYKLPDDFVISVYKNMYSDLSDFDDDKIIEHYLLHGCVEGRLYK